MKFVLYTNELKSWIFGKAGAKSLNQRNGAEAAQPETVERWRRVQNLGCRLCQKSNFSVHLCIILLLTWTAAFASFTSDFSLRMKEKGGNWIFSPFSIQTCLSMAASGALGDTYDCFSSLNLEETFPCGIQIANGVWIRNDLSLFSSYKDEMQSRFSALIESVPFNRETTARINGWVGEKTGGHILDLLPQDALSQGSSLVLASALFIQGVWTNPFAEMATRFKPFYPTDAAPIEALMMSQTARLPYFENEKMQVVGLPLKTEGGSFLCLLVLPKTDEVPFTEIESIAPFLSVRNVHLEVPKFKVEAWLDAADDLKALGMGKAFSKSANFSKISPNAGLFLGSIFHRVYFSFEEKGLEAAAATAAVLFQTTSLPSEKQWPVEFIANRPFTYLLLDTKCKTPLFVGAMEIPYAP